MRKRRIIRIAEGQDSNNRILVAFQKYVQMQTSFELEMSLFEEIAQSTSTFICSLSPRRLVLESSHADFANKMVRSGRNRHYWMDAISRNALFLSFCLEPMYQFKITMGTWKEVVASFSKVCIVASDPSER